MLLQMTFEDNSVLNSKVQSKIQTWSKANTDLLKLRGKIRCYGEVSILCRPATPAVCYMS